MKETRIPRRNGFKGTTLVLTLRELHQSYAGKGKCVQSTQEWNPSRQQQQVPLTTTTENWEDMDSE